MAYSRNTLLLLAQMASRLRVESRRTIDVPYMSMSARYADHVLGLALQSPTAELKALGALVRHDFFGPAVLVPGGKMLWSANGADTYANLHGPTTLDFAGPPPTRSAKPAAALS